MTAYYELKYTVDETDDAQRNWMVTVPSFPEITTFGDDQKEAAINGRKAIEEAIAARMSHNEDIPVPLKETNGRGRYIELPLMVILKCGLYHVCKSKNVSRAELARRLDWHREQVDRLFRLDHNSRLDQLEDAFKAVGSPITISFPDADLKVA